MLHLVSDVLEKLRKEIKVSVPNCKGKTVTPLVTHCPSPWPREARETIRNPHGGKRIPMGKVIAGRRAGVLRAMSWAFSTFTLGNGTFI